MPNPIHRPQDPVGQSHQDLLLQRQAQVQEVVQNQIGLRRFHLVVMDCQAGQSCRVDLTCRCPGKSQLIVSVESNNTTDEESLPRRQGIPESTPTVVSLATHGMLIPETTVKLTLPGKAGTSEPLKLHEQKDRETCPRLIGARLSQRSPGTQPASRIGIGRIGPNRHRDGSIHPAPSAKAVRPETGLLTVPTATMEDYQGTTPLLHRRPHLRPKQMRLSPLSIPNGLDFWPNLIGWT